jgi:hypothetical protein
MPSQPSRGRRQKVGSSCSRRSSSSAGYFPCQEENGAFDDEVDPPSSNAHFVTGLRMHPATLSQGPREPPTDFTSKGVDSLQKIRFTNPTLTPRCNTQFVIIEKRVNLLIYIYILPLFT